MRNTIPRYELAETSMEMAKTIPDYAKRDACMAAAFAFASKYLKEDEKSKLLEVLNMDLLEMLGERLEKHNATKIAKSMLADNVSVDFVARHTELDEETVIKLKEEMENASALAAVQ